MSYVIGIDTGITTGITILDKDSKFYNSYALGIQSLIYSLQSIKDKYFVKNTIVIIEYALTPTNSELSKNISIINSVIKTMFPDAKTVSAGTWKQLAPIKNMVMPAQLKSRTTHEKDAYKICMWYLRTLDKG